METSAADTLRKVLDPATGLDALMRQFPDVWTTVSADLLAVMEQRKAEAFKQYMQEMRALRETWTEKVRRSGNEPHTVEAAVIPLLRARMSFLALEKYYLAVAAGQDHGTVRLSLWNGNIIQRLCFRRGLERKAVSLTWFNRLWPLVSQKRVLMPLLQPKGIYCFYSDRLIEGLSTLVDGRSCLEIAAGDGTLSRLMHAAGTPVVATDDHSWSQQVTYPSDVERLDAAAALKKYKPRVVLCSWPPPGNAFEKHVFKTESVELYVVIGSRHGFASGNQEAYAAQKGFRWWADLKLARAVVPPELDSAVLVFSRL